SEEDSDPEQAQRDKDMQKDLALIAKYFKRIYKPTNNNLITSSNSRNKNVDTTLRLVVQQSGIQCFNWKEFGHFAKECRKPKRVKDSAYHKEKMLLCKEAEKCVLIQAEQYDWLPDTDEEIDEQELEAHYSYMAKIQETEFEKYKAFNDCTIDYDDLEHTGESAKSTTHGAAATGTGETALDMEILIQTCLMPLALKTQNDSFIFVHELKQEMHASLKYVESLEKEIDELESDKVEFTNMYDMILQECVSNEVMCSYLLSFSDSDALAELQCLYLHKVKECGCLAQKLSKQTKYVSNKVHVELLQCFAKVEKHSISLEIALQKCKEQGNVLLTGNRGSDLYTISLQESTSPTPLCLMAKASPTQAWLWHRRLSHLNFDYINLLLKKDAVIGLPKLKFIKDQLCSSYELSKAKRSSFKSKVVLSSKGRLNLLHMDLCGPMGVASINRKKYILVIVDDYSRYTWTLFLRSKDETP
nr:retrovirus-related Pol polyprotein from transposon TNT 1-94 [Tanacetum cinerariifolium]